MHFQRCRASISMLAPKWRPPRLRFKPEVSVPERRGDGRIQVSSRPRLLQWDLTAGEPPNRGTELLSPSLCSSVAILETASGDYVTRMLTWMLTMRGRAHTVMLCHVSSIALIFPNNLVTFADLKKKKKNHILKVFLFGIIYWQIAGVGSKAEVKAMQMICSWASSHAP